MTGTELEAPVVIVIDDDPMVRRALDSLFRSIGLATTLYESATAFLAAQAPSRVSCIITDVRMPGVSGLDFQKALTAQGVTTPVIVITGHGDVPMSVGAMKAGAVDFLTKPFRDQDLIDAVNEALERDRRTRERAGDVAGVEARYAQLTPRERQVMDLVVGGLMNKQAAAELGLSEVTVKLHRSSLMRKMQVHTVADLVRLSQDLTPKARA
ncbi:response regulator transcription factor [Brevundimonas sp. DWR2-3-1b1]|uniref:response regulator transcription factor n=1 Tax=unclassified Brevundimonas TaxID=2622653 RepID=UPI003CEAA193